MPPRQAIGVRRVSSSAVGKTGSCLSWERIRCCLPMRAIKSRSEGATGDRHRPERRTVGAPSGGRQSLRRYSVAEDTFSTATPFHDRANFMTDTQDRTTAGISSGVDAYGKKLVPSHVGPNPPPLAMQAPGSSSMRPSLIHYTIRVGGLSPASRAGRENE